MAAIHAGVKRSYHQMRAPERSSPSPASSRETSPLRSSRGVSSAPALRSGFDTPSKDGTELLRKTTFEPNASIVLVGVRGVGKTSLGILAATAYGRRLVETERAFFESTGTTTQAYRKLHGAAEYHQKHHQVLKRTLEAHSQNCVIICSFSDLENRGSMLLREYAERHPVIHVTRDAKGIQPHLQVWSLERTKQLLLTSGPLLRSCTNYEFLNLSEKLAERPDEGVQDLAKSHNGLFLTLKRVERDFLKMLRNIVGDHDREQSHHSAYPLSLQSAHCRQFTLSAVTDVDSVVDATVDLDDLQVGVDAVDLKLRLHSVSEAKADDRMERDFLRTAEAFAIVRRSTILPIILTVTSQDAKPLASELRANLMSFCQRLAPEYCTIDLDMEDSQLEILVAGKGRTNVIGKARMKQAPVNGWNDEACMAAYDRARRFGCDLVKITMPARNVADNFSAQAFRQKMDAGGSQLPLIAYNTGKLGRLSMCFNNVLTPVKSPSSNRAEETASHEDARVTAKEVFTSLFASFVYEPMKFFIYGANVGYSLSPLMHNAAYTACGMPHIFGKHSSATLDHFEHLACDPHFGGAAVVQPYKTGVVPLLNGMSSHAKAIGSVNTIIPVRELNRDGAIPDDLQLLSQVNRTGPVKALYGHNTDWIGIRACFRRGLSPANTVRPQTTGLICGAGGQARSTIYSMLSLGVRNIFVCNRTVKNAVILANHYNKLIESHAISELDSANAPHTRVRVLPSFDSPWPKEFRQPSMIVSSIPTQNVDGSPTNFTIPDDWLKSPTGGVLIELAYRPMMTPIVRQMRAQAHKGWIFMDGFDILPEQAFAQFELFTGRRAPRKLMRDEVIKRYREEQSQQGVNVQNRDPNPSGIR